MKRFETFGEYMFDLLFAPLKKRTAGKSTNSLYLVEVIYQFSPSSFYSEPFV